MSGDPEDDAIDHDTDGDCVCGPTTEPVVRGDGSIVWLVIHHRLTDASTTGDTRGE